MTKYQLRCATGFNAFLIALHRLNWYMRRRIWYLGLEIYRARNETGRMVLQGDCPRTYMVATSDQSACDLAVQVIAHCKEKQEGFRMDKSDYL